MKNANSIYFRLLCLLFVTLTIASCGGETEPKVDPTRRLIIYMIVPPDMREAASWDMAEIDAVRSSLPADLELLTLVDTTSLAADSATFARNIACFADNPKSLPTGLVLWSHGRGWVSFGNDAAGHRLAIPALAKALSAFREPLRFIFFDACFMQSVEVAYELRNLTAAILASPAEMPGRGAPYDKVLPMLTQAVSASPTTTASALRKAADVILKEYSSPSDGLVLSLLAATDEQTTLAPMLEALADSFAQVVPSYFASRREYDLGYPYLSTSCQQYGLFRTSAPLVSPRSIVPSFDTDLLRSYTGSITVDSSMASPLDIPPTIPRHDLVPHPSSLISHPSSLTPHPSSSTSLFLPDFYDLTSVLYHIGGAGLYEPFVAGAFPPVGTPRSDSFWATDSWYSTTIGHRGRIIDRAHASGISLFVPDSRHSDDVLSAWHRLEWYSASAFSHTGW